MQELGRHNGLRMIEYSFLKDYSCHRNFLSAYLWSISYVQTDLAKNEGLLIKIKVIKGF